MKKCFFFPANLLVSIFLLFLLGAQVSFAFSVPQKPESFVNDFSGTLSTEEVTSLENKISAFEKQTSNEISVVIVPTLNGDVIENVAQEIFTTWGIGKAEKNNGVLLLVAMEEHKTRIHTGYGAEGDLTDLATSYIQSEVMRPLFQEGKYFEGINGALDEIISSLSGSNIVPEDYSQNKESNTDWSFVFVFVFIILQWIIAILGRSKSWWGGGVLGAGIGGVIWFLGFFSFIISLILFIFLIVFGLGLDFVVSRSYQKAKSAGKVFPWWIGGGGGFGGGSGGFGGFGGGSSGGGGSSSSW